MKRFRNITKLISVAMVAITVIISSVVTVSAAGGTTGACTWTLDGTSLTITGTGAMADYTNGGTNPAPWYNNRASITNVTIGENVTYIGNYAFAGLSKLATVTIPAQIKGIGDRAFSNCTSLEIVNFNASKCSMMGSSNQMPVFFNCNALTTINIGSNVKYIPNFAFEKCEGLTSINIPESVYYIGSYAFAYCSALESITMSDKLTELPEYVFYECSSLTTVDIPTLMSKIGNYAFYKCYALKELEIPAAVSQIGYGAFQDCTNLHITTTTGSYAELVAKQYGISYTATGTSTGGGYTEPELSTTTNTSAKFLNGSLILGVKFDSKLNGECVHIAFYDNANQVVNYYIVPIFGEMDNINFAIDDDRIKTATRAKVFIWDSLDSCRPISAPETVELN